MNVQHKAKGVRETLRAVSNVLRHKTFSHSEKLAACHTLHKARSACASARWPALPAVGAVYFSWGFLDHTLVGMSVPRPDLAAGLSCGLVCQMPRDSGGFNADCKRKPSPAVVLYGRMGKGSRPSYLLLLKVH